MNEMLEKMRIAVLEGEEEIATKLANEAISSGLDLKAVMDEGFLKGISEAGKRYSDGEYFLPDLVCSADAMKSALEVLDKELKKPSSNIKPKGKVLIATVQGDVHDIGKIIVAAMLTAAGYDVHDLGADVPNDTVVKTVKELKPHVLGLSALLTTTMEEQKNIIELLLKEGVRDDVKVIVGGAPVTSKWAEKIRADGYSDDAIGAVNLVDSFMI